MLNKLKYSLCFICSIILCNSNEILFKMNSNLNWSMVEELGDQKIYEFNNAHCNCIYSKIEKPVDYKEDDILDVITNINGYNSIIKNNSLTTSLIEIENDTIYAYQIIENSIPFVRDRQYIFKMYSIGQNHIEWMILNKESDFLIPYLDDEIKTLSVGAGSWSFRYENNQKILVNKIYVDDEVNLPGLFINKLKRNNVVQIFNDVLNYVKKQEGE